MIHALPRLRGPSIHYVRFPPATCPADARAEPACGVSPSPGTIVTLSHADVTCLMCRATDLYRGVVRDRGGRPVPQPREDEHA